MHTPTYNRALTRKGDSCSTFLLRQADAFIIGHNLDEGFHVPGVIVANKRDVQKTSVSLMEMLTGQPSPSPTTSWTSKYGSITLCPFGREFPDGGINEAGLYIQEMTLPDTRFPDDDSLPKMFMMQWMQYQLDNHESVEQVLDTLSQIVLDGWTWHFFTCDKSGASAAIEFVDGQTQIYAGNDMPIPVLCNTAYPQELDNLKNYRGFGGNKPIDPDDKETERFVHAAYMIAQPVPTQTIDHGFDILRMLERGSTQWSYVIDVQSGQISFFTARAKKRKTFSIDAFDYACNTPVKVLDMHVDLEGDVSALFADYAPEPNRQLVSEQIKSLDRNGEVARLIESFGNSLTNVIDAISGYSDSTICVA